MAASSAMPALAHRYCPAVLHLLSLAGAHALPDPPVTIDSSPMLRGIAHASLPKQIGRGKGSNQGVKFSVGLVSTAAFASAVWLDVVLHKRRVVWDR